MSRAEIIETLHAYIAEELLDGDDTELDEATPLLEWGIVDSLAMVNLITELEERFGVEIDEAEVTAENFGRIAAIAEMIGRKTREPGPRPGTEEAVEARSGGAQNV